MDVFLLLTRGSAISTARFAAPLHSLVFTSLMSWIFIEVGHNTLPMSNVGPRCVANGTILSQMGLAKAIQVLTQLREELLSSQALESLRVWVVRPLEIPQFAGSRTQRH